MVKTSTSDRLPLSPTRSPDAGFVWWQSLLFAVLLVGALFVTVAIALTFMIVAGLAQMADLKAVSPQILAAQFVADAAVLAVMIPLLPALARRSWRALGWKAPRWRDIGYAVGGTILMLLASGAAAFVQEHVVHVKADEVQVHWLRAARGVTLWMFVVLACIAGPIIEELIFRGFIFNALRRYMPVWFAIVLSASVFGLSHLQPGNGGVIVPLAVGGAVLAWVYYRTGSLVASMVTHALFNLVPVVLIAVFRVA